MDKKRAGTVDQALICGGLAPAGDAVYCVLLAAREGKETRVIRLRDATKK